MDKSTQFKEALEAWKIDERKKFSEFCALNAIRLCAESFAAFGSGDFITGADRSWRACVLGAASARGHFTEGEMALIDKYNALTEVE